jgi:beta-phosphoglucomutase-like phosphatase (HAD superfamily)
MTPSFDTARPRPVPTVLDQLRTKLDLDAYDLAVFWLDTVVRDLGYGDVRALPGAVAWIDKLRGDGKKTAVASSGTRAETALELAGIADRFDLIIPAVRGAAAYSGAFESCDVEPARALAVEADPGRVQAARDAGIRLVIGVAGDGRAAEDLRRAGVDVVVADLQELLGPFVR